METHDARSSLENFNTHYIPQPLTSSINTKITIAFTFNLTVTSLHFENAPIKCIKLIKIILKNNPKRYLKTFYLNN